MERWADRRGVSRQRHAAGSVCAQRAPAPNPIAPLSIFKIRGLGAANATQLTAIAGFYAMFFFVTLYMQNVLGYSPIRAGMAYLPVTVGVAVGFRDVLEAVRQDGHPTDHRQRRAHRLRRRLPSLPLPVHGSYLTDLLPGLLVMSLGLGAVFVGVTTAANAGVPPTKPGLAAGLINTSQWLGAALGLAIFTAIATSRTNHLLASTPRFPSRSPKDSVWPCCAAAYSSPRPRSSPCERQTPGASPGGRRAGLRPAAIDTHRPSPDRQEGHQPGTAASSCAARRSTFSPAGSYSLNQRPPCRAGVHLAL